MTIRPTTTTASVAATIAVAVALSGGVSGGALAAPAPVSSATPAPRARPTAAPTLPPVPAPSPTPTAPAVPPPVAVRINKVSGHASASRMVTLTGSLFENLAGVQVAGVPVTDLRVISSTSARFRLPAAIDYQAKVAPISLVSAADRIARPSGVTFTYLTTNRRDRQMAYAFQNWNRTASTRYGYLSGNDCANFASQTLLARGWKQSPEWFNGGQGRWSATWVSSTALSTWLKKRPDLATRLRYRDRDGVAVGDIVQFRWPGHGKKYTAWDHTGVVSKVVVDATGRQDVYYVSHTIDRQYGGSTQSFARWMAKDLRIQFFHLER